MRTRALSIVLVMSFGAGLAASPVLSAAPRTASVTIRHQLRGCHAWSVNGGPFAASHRLALTRGGAITFTNDDVMSHRLVKLSGPAVRMQNGTTMPMGGTMHGSAAPGTMNHMGATTTVSFSHPGTYRFKTKAGEDYMGGIRTVGEDNVLTLTVTVR